MRVNRDKVNNCASMARDIYSRYVRSCEKRSLEPIPSVLESCKSGSSTLNLSGNCISVENCRVLAKTLQHGHLFTEMDFSDCLIGDEGISMVLVRIALGHKQLAKSICIRFHGNNSVMNIIITQRSLQANGIPEGWYSSNVHNSKGKYKDLVCMESFSACAGQQYQVTWNTCNSWPPQKKYITWKVRSNNQQQQQVNRLSF